MNSVVVPLILVAVFGSSWSADNEHILSRTKRQTERCEQADMVFVLDSSGSIGIDNWGRVLEFVSTVVEDFSVGENNVRVGVTTYGNRATINFNLNSFFDKADIVDAVKRIEWKDQMTNTSGGIKTAHEVMFTETNGDRSGIPNVMLVITDGVSNRDENETIPQANKAREKGIIVIALGIGDQVDQNELLGIANKNPNWNPNLPPGSDIEEYYVFSAADFESLPVIKDQVVAAACETLAACRSQSDLLFILDTSTSIGEQNFKAIKAFMQGVVNETNVLDDSTRIGLISFNNQAKLEFQLGTHQSRADVNAAIEQAAYAYGIAGTNTAAALRMARVDVYGGGQNRPNVMDIAVIFTDGGSDDLQQTISEARDLRMAGVHVLVVAMGKWLNMVEMYELATDPDHLNVLRAPTAADLTNLAGFVKTAICNDNNECASNPCRNGGQCQEGINYYRCVCPNQWAGINCEIPCSKQADVAIAMDASTSIGQENFYQMQNFVKKLARTLNIKANDHTHFGVETFGDAALVRYPLDRYSNSHDAANAISFMWQMGQTNTAAALSAMGTQIFTQGGDRQNVRNVGILLTDGRSNNRLTTFQEAVRLHNAGVSMLTVGVGVTHRYDRLELEGIASDPDSQTVFYTTNYTTLQDITDALTTTICDAENSCASFPCQGETQCVDKIGGYECRCSTSRTGVNCERRCSGEADVVFMVDSSGSIRRHRFEMFKDYVINVIRQLDIRPERTRVGLLTFNDAITQRFQLNTYNTKEDIVQAIKRIEWIPGRTNIADALQTARDTMFTAANGDRANVPDFGIILTDGQATVNPERTLPEAIATRVAGIHLIAVAAERKTDSLELKGIASDPDEANVFAVDRFSQLNTLENSLINAMCDDEDECRSNPCQNGAQCVNGLKQYICLCSGAFTGINCERRCSTRVDVAFILDSSGSVEDKFDRQMKLARLVVQGLNFDGSRTRVAVTTYSTDALLRFDFNAYTDKQSVLNAIAFTLTGGRTHTAAALRINREEVFSSANGDRTDPNFVVFMSDAFSNVFPEQTLPEAQLLRDNTGATLIAVGIGPDVNRAELDSMASDPDSENSLQLDSDDQLESVANRILDVICQ